MAWLYGAWVSGSFARVGRNLRIYGPLYLHGGKYVAVGDDFCADCRLRMDAFVVDGDTSLKVVIGNGVNIQKDCHIGAVRRITIGDGVLIGSRVFISDHSHGEISAEALQCVPMERPIYSKGEVVIEDRVWIGEDVCILPGVTIGQNSVVGAGAVVTRSVPPFSVVVGNPARVVRTF